MELQAVLNGWIITDIFLHLWQTNHAIWHLVMYETSLFTFPRTSHQFLNLISMQGVCEINQCMQLDKQGPPITSFPNVLKWIFWNGKAEQYYAVKCLDSHPQLTVFQKISTPFELLHFTVVKKASVVMRALRDYYEWLFISDKDKSAAMHPRNESSKWMPFQTLCICQGY